LLVCGCKGKAFFLITQTFLRKNCEKSEFFAKSYRFSPVFGGKGVNLQPKKKFKEVL